MPTTTKPEESLSKYRVAFSEHELAAMIHLLQKEKDINGTLDAVMSVLARKISKAYNNALGGFAAVAYTSVPAAEKKKPLSYAERLALLDDFDMDAFNESMKEFETPIEEIKNPLHRELIEQRSTSSSVGIQNPGTEKQS